MILDLKPDLTVDLIQDSTANVILDLKIYSKPDLTPDRTVDLITDLTLSLIADLTPNMKPDLTVNWLFN